ncbi:hypothetical protein DP113_02905 [Brasilonema octagenarum UFV-E1]|uniref:Filamentous haemagglutinin FhaB/tRNA nuclease CdiA-like TPS domain-containing protein n=1 Tax=Brasilonema sennae CENA114 TaxID=415709 RepID=A0A856M882_9CYAN|nr:hypothetical protein DP114_02950 [Brasilonema sennae CENA114]QDL13370.1 hypothetical protein DP113_02905 [Brasilonema octagenarum UFV-E1]
MFNICKILRIKPVHHPLFFLTLPLATVFSLTYLSVAKAQITPDNSLGAQPSVVTPNVQINGTPSDRIDGGAIRGDNLFHSFQEFNVNANRGAYFSNPAGIANILTRVTGGNISNIQGVLGVLGKANLFLINPNGILFGPNARLDVGGSFLGSTANSLIFKNGFEFSATNPQAPPLLTITAPVGLSYRENFKNITTQSTTTQYPILEVPEGQTLALVGGNVILDRPDLLAPGGRVELGGLSAPGTVGLNSDGSLSFPVGVQRGDVSLTNEARVDVSSGGGGSIAVNARNLDISGGSILRAGIGSGLGTVGSQAGDITLDATGNIKIVGSYVFNNVRSQGVGNGGNINITTGSLSLTDGAQLNASTLGLGNTGNVSVRALGAVELANTAYIFSTVEAGGVGKGGNIDIRAATLSLKDGAQLATIVGQASDTQPAGRGNAGNVTVDVTGPVTIAGVKDGFRSGIFSNVRTGATGNGGNIAISSGSFSLSDGTQLSTITYGQGNAGNVSVRASDAVLLVNADIFSTVEAGAVGKGGNINIQGASLSLKDGARLDASTRGLGDAGNVTIFSSRSVSFEGVGSNGSPSGVFSTVQPTATGDSGSIRLQTGTLSVTNGAAIIASTLGKGNAGNVNITASDTISFDGIGSDGSPSGISSSVGSGVVGGGGGIKIERQEVNGVQKGVIEPQVRFSITIEPFRNASFPDAVGNSGNIDITTRSLSVTNGARLTTSTFGRGDAGNIAIRASDKISFDGVSSRDGSPSGAFSAVDSSFFGRGGDLNITTGLLSVTNGAQLVTSTLKKGNAGNITLNARDAVFDGVNSKGSPSGVFAAVDTNAEGKGGDITIKAESVSLTKGAQLAANSRGRGDAGKITITASDTALFQGIGSNGVPSRASSAVETGAVGNGGNLTVVAGRFNVLNGAEGTVSNLGSGNAGNLTVRANSINLDDQGKLTANSANGIGGDIILQARDLLLLRRNSLISAISGTSGSAGQDGNININTQLLVAFPQENSDITATGFGRTAGSNVQVNISKPGGIFGIEYQPQFTPNSDIVATGTVTVTSIDLDPTQGLFELTETVVDPAQQVALNPCIKGFGSTFTITGRGGLPTDPNKILSSDNVRVDLIQPVPTKVSSTSTRQKQPSQKPPVKQIIPAQGWIYNEKGQVVLVGYDPTKTGPQREQPAPNSSCAAVK